MIGILLDAASLLIAALAVVAVSLLAVEVYRTEILIKRLQKKKRGRRC